MTLDWNFLSRVAPLPVLASLFVAACGSASGDETGSAASAAGAVSAAWIDANVQTFKPLARGSNVVYVQRTDGNLYREVPGTAPVWVDGNVRAYKPIDGTVVYVLGTDGKLWREIGTMNNRTQVASGVSGFDVAMDGTEGVYYLDTSNALYLDLGGSARKLLASSVRGFQWTPGVALLTPALYVLGTDGNLWRGTPDYTHHSWYPIETSVSSFRAIDALTYQVEQNSTQLWLEYDTNGLQQTARGARVPIDSQAEFFWPVDGSTSFVEDQSFTLWREEYGLTHRDRVDGNGSTVRVKAFQPMDKDTVYVLHMDGNLYLETLANPPCNYRFSAPHPTPNVSGTNFNYVAAWVVETHSKTCPNRTGANGHWYNWNRHDPIPNIPGGFVAPPPPSCEAFGLSSTCCLYVWQPTNGAMQDPSVLCTADTASLEAWVDQGSYYPVGLTTGSPNGGGCGTCGPTGTW